MTRRYRAAMHRRVLKYLPEGGWGEGEEKVAARTTEILSLIFKTHSRIVRRCTPKKNKEKLAFPAVLRWGDPILRKIIKLDLRENRSDKTNRAR